MQDILIIKEILEGEETNKEQPIDPNEIMTLSLKLREDGSSFNDYTRKQAQLMAVLGEFVLPNELMQYAYLLRSLEHHLGNFHSKSIIEIGCETGDFLYVLSSYGAAIKGINKTAMSAYVGNQAFSIIASKLGNIHCGLAEQILAEQKSTVDAIVSHNVMLNDTVDPKQMSEIIDKGLAISSYQAHSISALFSAYPLSVFERKGVLVRETSYPYSARVIELIKQ